jgi:hypothetical protein
MVKLFHNPRRAAPGKFADERSRGADETVLRRHSLRTKEFLSQRENATRTMLRDDAHARVHDDLVTPGSSAD